MMDAITAALDIFEAHPAKWRRIQRAGMLKDFSWHRAAAQYEAVLERVAAASTYCK